MPPSRFTCVSITCCLLVALTASAAEQTVKGKVKSVDVVKNSITLGDLELDVTRKTKITVDGKQAKLTDITAGQPANVIYDDKLDVAVSIVVGEDEPASKNESVAYKKTGCRVVWTFAENGDSVLTVSRPLEKRAPSKDSMIRHDDGTVEFQYEFNSVESVEKAFAGTTENVVFDKSHEALVTKTKHAQFSYSNTTKLPISLEVELDKTSESNGITFVLQIVDVVKGESALINLILNEALDSAVKLDALSWVTPDLEKKKPKFQPFLDDKGQKVVPEQMLALAEPKIYKLKVPMMKSDQRYWLNFGVHGEAATMKYLAIRGRLSPRMGIKFSEKSGPTVENVFPNGLADTIGIKSGDLLTSVNGKKLTTLKEAVELLAKIQFGEESEIVVKRNGKTVKIGFTAE